MTCRWISRTNIYLYLLIVITYFVRKCYRYVDSVGFYTHSTTLLRFQGAYDVVRVRRTSYCSCISSRPTRLCFSPFARLFVCMSVCRCSCRWSDQLDCSRPRRVLLHCRIAQLHRTNKIQFLWYTNDIRTESSRRMQDTDTLNHDGEQQTPPVIEITHRYADTSKSKKTFSVD